MSKQKRRDRGSPRGRISLLESWLIFWGRKFWWVGAGIFYGIGDAAQYVKDNWAMIHSSVPWYAAAGILVLIGIILVGRDAKKVKNTDTRVDVPPKEVK